MVGRRLHVDAPPLSNHRHGAWSKRMYTHINFKTKKALKLAVADGQEVTYFQPGPFGGQEPSSGTIFVEGPHYPQPHKWYASCKAENGRIVKVS